MDPARGASFRTRCLKDMFLLSSSRYARPQRIESAFDLMRNFVYCFSALLNSGNTKRPGELSDKTADKETKAGERAHIQTTSERVHNAEGGSNLLPVRVSNQ